MTEKEYHMELNLMSSKQAAELWGITDRQVQSLCLQGKIKEAKAAKQINQAKDKRGK